MAADQIILTQLDESKEQAAREFERTLKNLWEEYGVREDSLLEEMTTWYWKRIPIGRKYHDVIAWKGLGVTLAETIEKHKVSILNAIDILGVAIALNKAKDSALLIALYLWNREKATGPLTPERMMRKASKADALANYLERQGKDDNAASQRKRAAILRRKAAGEDIELPKRASGAIDKVRSIYAELEKEGNKSRAELIKAAIEAGIHPGTAAVQYAWWRREQRDK